MAPPWHPGLNVVGMAYEDGLRWEREAPKRAIKEDSAAILTDLTMRSEDTRGPKHDRTRRTHSSSAFGNATLFYWASGQLLRKVPML